MKRHLLRIRNSNVAHNVIALSGTQVAMYIFPLITTPYLARILGPDQWGVVAFAQALGLYFTMVVDFGFTLSATRQVARLRDDLAQVEEIAAGVMGAKVLLSILSVGALFVLQAVLPAFQRNRFILWEGAISGIVAGFSMLWFYQGFENMKMPAAVGIVGRALSTIAIFAFIHRKQDAWIVLAIQIVAYFAITVVLFSMAARRIRFKWPSYSAILSALRESASMFLFKGAVSLYTTANTLILGNLASSVSVGLYSGAERVTKSVFGMLSPLSQSLFPRVSRLIAVDRKRAVYVARVSLGLMAAVGGAFGILLYFAAPLIVHLLLGKNFDGAIPVMRILSLLMPLIAISNVLGMQWMLPLKMDRVFNIIIVSGGILNVALAFLWAPRWQHVGMAAAVVCSEAFVTVGMTSVLCYRNLFPLFPRRVLEIRLLARMGAE